jgi:hypothetical protein
VEAPAPRFGVFMKSILDLPSSATALSTYKYMVDTTIQHKYMVDATIFLDTTITSELSHSSLPLGITVENNDDNGRFITFCSLRIGTLSAILLGAR